MGKNIIAIIQARMGSKRFPGKVLADVVGRPMLWHVVNRARFAHRLQKVVVATSLDSSDDPVEKFCRQNDIPLFRGSEEDVLDRFYQAAKKFEATSVVRITADCPLIDSTVIDKVIEVYQQRKCDYATNTMRYTYPDGLDVEVFSFSVLEQSWREAKRPAEREHVTRYIRNTAGFDLHNVEADNGKNCELRWTVDDPKDLQFVREVYARLSPENFTCGHQVILDILEKEPHLMELNQNQIQNEGYYKTLLKEKPIVPTLRSLERSLLLKEKAARLIPSLSQTFSKGPSQFVQGVSPVFLKKGAGSHVWDVDDNEYIDYPMALGPIILGHNYPAVTKAVHAQIQDGTVFSLPHPLEIEVAEELVQSIPCAEMVRFGKNGSDVTSAAVRVARAYTGRDVIACSGYHGWQDWFIGTTTRNKGVPKSVQSLTLPFSYNDLQSLERIFKEHPGEVAAVIMEPVGIVEPKDQFLQKVAALAKKEGAVLIFDEIVTGFRIALGGAQEYFGVVPDLACFGKAMANGWPLSAVVGSREIMSLFDEIFFSFTFGGEAVSLAAAKAVLQEIKNKNVIEHLWAKGKKLKEGFNVLAKAYGLEACVECVGLPPRTSVGFKDVGDVNALLLKSLFQQECMKRGILFSGGHNICFSHSDVDIDYTLRVYRSSLEILAEALLSKTVEKKLEGKPVEAVFRKA